MTASTALGLLTFQLPSITNLATMSKGCFWKGYAIERTNQLVKCIKSILSNALLWTPPRDDKESLLGAYL